MKRSVLFWSSMRIITVIYVCLLRLCIVLPSLTNTVPTVGHHRPSEALLFSVVSVCVFVGSRAISLATIIVSSRVQMSSLVMTPTPCRVAGCIISVRRIRIHALVHLLTCTVGSAYKAGNISRRFSFNLAVGT